MKTFYFTNKRVYKIEANKAPVVLATFLLDKNGAFNHLEQAVRALVIAGELPNKYLNKPQDQPHKFFYLM